jgi:DNA polymerase V
VGDSNFALGLAAFAYIVPELKRAGKAGKLEEAPRHACGFDISVRRFPVLRPFAPFIFLHTDRLKDVPQYAASRSLAVAPKSDSTLELMPLALKGLNQVYREGYEIRKAGVLLNDLELADSAPRRLWDAALYEIHKRLFAAVDSLNARLGKDTLRCGLFPSSGAWRTKFARRSPNYTTNWGELMTAR